jgi:sphingomyelin phosphodiesterase acid-like 3
MRRLCITVLFFLISLAPPVSLFLRASPPPAPAGKALLIADLHFDPLSDPAIVKQLIAAPASNWETIFAGSGQTGYAHSPQDTNYPLLNSALTAAASQTQTLADVAKGGDGAKSADFAIALGDYLRHDFEAAFVKTGADQKEFAAFATKTAVYVSRTLQAKLGVPVYLALGNDDSPCGDYKMAPGSPFLAALADSLDVLVQNPEAAADFRAGGFYELPHPTVPNYEILVLNSVLWSSFYSNCGADKSDPGAAELDWLSSKLYRAKTLGNRVILVMHIPPGIDSYNSAKAGSNKPATEFWQNRYFTRFGELMQSYGEIVEVAFAGHTHMDDFRVLSTPSGAAVAFRITPAVSPIFGNNPAFSICDYSLSTGGISDLATYFLDLAKGGDNPEWAFEYRFSKAYGYSAYTAANLEALTATIQADSNIRQVFANYYAASAPSPITPKNWPFYICAEAHFTAADYSSCVSGTPTHP